MRKILVLILSLLLSGALKSQYQIKNAQTKEPVSFAHIQLAQKRQGTNANYSGVFYLDSTFKAKDSLIISCIGYTSKTLAVKNLSLKSPVLLQPLKEELAEVQVSTKKLRTRTKTLGVKKKPSLWDLPDVYEGVAYNGEQRAVWLPNPYSLNGYLQRVNIYVTDLGFPDAHFRVHVYNCSPFEIRPAEELTKSNIIASGSSGKEWVEVDMRAERIEVGENGCFVGIEWFDSPRALSYLDTVHMNGTTYSNGKEKDTVYSRVRKGQGAVLGVRYQKHRKAKNKSWRKENGTWVNRGHFANTEFYTTDTFPNGELVYRTPDNHIEQVLCINIDVAFPKGRIKLDFDEPRKRKLNRITKTKKDLFKYPQASISQLFASLIKAFENNDVVYILKYLCTYKDDELDKILENLNTDGEELISEQKRLKIVQSLKELEAQLDSAELTTLDKKHYELKLGNEKYNLVVNDGLWRINPYGYTIYKEP